MFNKFASKYRSVVVAVAGAPLLFLGSLARAADESGITTTEAMAVIADGKVKGLVIALGMFGLVIAFRIVKKVTSAA